MFLRSALFPTLTTVASTWSLPVALLSHYTPPKSIMPETSRAASN